MTRICLHCSQYECNCGDTFYVPAKRFKALKKAEDRLKHPVLTPWIQDSTAQELADLLYGPKEARCSA